MPTRSRPIAADRGARDLQGHAVAAFDAAAVAVAAQVDERVQKLLDEVAVSAVQFDPVEPGIQRELRRQCVLLDGVGDIGLGHGARRTVWLQAKRVCEHLARARGRAGPERRDASGQVGNRRHSAAADRACAQALRGCVSSAPSPRDWRGAASGAAGRVWGFWNVQPARRHSSGLFFGAPSSVQSMQSGMLT